MKIHKGHIHGVSFNLYKNSNDSGIVLKRDSTLKKVKLTINDKVILVVSYNDNL